MKFRGLSYFMPDYIYKAVDKFGNPVSGIITADNPAGVATQLKAMGYFISGINENKKIKKKGFILELTTNKIKQSDVVLFVQQLATMLNAGLPITRTLNILTRETKNHKFKEMLNSIRINVESGITISESIAKYPKVFPALFVNLFHAGESSGTLPDTLQSLVEYMDYQAEVKSKLKSAFIYPAVLVIVAIGVVLFLLVYVLPQFAETFKGLNIELPLPTRIVMDTSQFLQLNFHYILVSSVIIVVISLILIKINKKCRLLYDKLKLNLPVIGVLIRKIILSIFSQTFATLLKSGLPILQSLEIAQRTVGNAVIANVISNVYTTVRDGGVISISLEKSGEFPPMFTNMVSVGEESGTVPQMLLKISNYYKQQVDVAVKDLIAIVEPSVLIAMGLVVGFIALALFMPLFTISGKIG